MYLFHSKNKYREFKKKDSHTLSNNIDGFEDNNNTLNELRKEQLNLILPDFRDIKFPVDGLNSVEKCLEIQNKLSLCVGINSVIASNLLDYIFLTYYRSFIRLSEIIALLKEQEITCNIISLKYQLDSGLDIDIALLSYRLILCRFVLDLQLNDALNEITLFTNPDYVSEIEARICINKILNDTDIKGKHLNSKF